MRKILIAVLIAVLSVSSACAVLPETYKEFKARYQSEGRTVEGAVKLYFEGVFAYMNPQTRKEGAKMLRYALHSDMPIERSTHYAKKSPSSVTNGLTWGCFHIPKGGVFMRCLSRTLFLL